MESVFLSARKNPPDTSAAGSGKRDHAREHNHR